MESYLFLGRGGDGFYPFTSIGIMSHELSHGFTTQHSNLTYDGGSGAMNEAFSDMAAQAVQYYLTGKNDWRIGAEIISDPVQAGCIDQKDWIALSVGITEYRIVIPVRYKAELRG